MRRRHSRSPETSLARLARWLGFDRNPLRRGTDRVETALRLVMIIVMLAVIPAPRSRPGGGPITTPCTELRSSGR